MDNRDFYRIFQGFFGLNRSVSGSPLEEERKDENMDPDIHENNPTFNNFQVFTDPLGK